MKRVDAFLHNLDVANGQDVATIHTALICGRCYLLRSADARWFVYNARGYLLHTATWRDALKYAREWGERCAGLGPDTPGEIDKLWPEVRAWLGKEVTQ